MKKKLYKILLLFSLIFIFSACSNISNKNIKWKEIDSSKGTFFTFKTGDIILKEKRFSPIGMFGHCGIMKNDWVLVDYPKLGEKSYNIDVDLWLEENRDILILRYKNMNEIFEKKLVENLEKYSGKKYKIVFDKKNSDTFYCSQFIWFVYYITAQELGFNLDIDSNKGIIVFPYDFINSKELKIIK